MNHKHPAKSLWRNSSFCTKCGKKSVLEFMSLAEMTESISRCGREAVIFICEIIDCCPCPKCTAKEVSMLAIWLLSLNLCSSYVNLRSYSNWYVVLSILCMLLVFVDAENLLLLG